MKVPYAIAAGWILTTVSGVSAQAQQPAAEPRAVVDEAKNGRNAAPRYCECRDLQPGVERPTGTPPAVGCPGDDAGRITAAKFVSAAMAQNPDGSATLDFMGDHLIRITIDASSLQAAIDSGVARAYGNTLVMTSNAADILLGTVLNSSGAAPAGVLTETNGTIVLDVGCPSLNALYASGAGMPPYSGTLTPPLDFGGAPFTASPLVPGPSVATQPLIVTPSFSSGPAPVMTGGPIGVPSISSAAPIHAVIPPMSLGTGTGITGGSPGVSNSAGTGSTGTTLSGPLGGTTGTGAGTGSGSGTTSNPIVASNPPTTITPPPTSITPPPVVTPPPTTNPPGSTSHTPQGNGFNGFRPNNGFGNGGGDGVPGKSGKTDSRR